MKIIQPVPDNAPSLPSRKGIKTKSGWINYDIDHLWGYHNRTGQVIGYTIRYETPEGKQVVPLTLWDDNGKQKWKFKTWPELRPLYNLNLICSKPNAKIILVEGEKCAELLQCQLNAFNNNNFVAAAWVGGSSGVYKIDWSPLKNRTVILWPDNDQQLDDSGNLRPVEQQPGQKCMLQIAGILSELGCKLKMIGYPYKIPNHYKDGYDVGDMIMAEMSLSEIINIVKTNLIDPPEILPKKPKERKPEIEKPDQNVNADAVSPIRCLGYNRGSYFFLPKSTRQVVALKTSELSTSNLLGLADLQYWELMYANRNGVNWKLAQSNLMRTCEQMGIFNISRLRGRGAWIDKDKWVLHLGNKLIVNGETQSTDKYKSDYVYDLAEPLDEITDVKPLSKQESFNLLKISKILNWERPNHAYYFAGWAVIAPICGALNWRPHIWVTGTSSAGKSWVLGNITQPCLGVFGVQVQSDTTEAGIRQKLGSDALPVLFDEFEGEDETARRRTQRVLELARQASSDKGGKILKGGQSGKAVEYEIRSSFCFSSIGVNLIQQADVSRITVCTLVDPIRQLGWTKEQKADHFSMLEAEVAKTMTPKWCARLRARSVRMIGTIRSNSRVFSLAISSVLGSKRAGDQLGALYAGAYSLVSDGEITLEDAKKFIVERDWTEEIQSTQYNDSVLCLNAILESKIRIGSNEVTVAEMLTEVKADPSTSEVYRSTLERHGIKISFNPVEILISTNNKNLRQLLSTTAWAASWGRLLARLPNVNTKAARFNGITSWSCVVSWSVVFDDNEISCI